MSLDDELDKFIHQEMYEKNDTFTNGRREERGTWMQNEEKVSSIF